MALHTMAMARQWLSSDCKVVKYTLKGILVVVVKECIRGIMYGTK
jgi:hypothetical protein